LDVPNYIQDKNLSGKFLAASKIRKLGTCLSCCCCFAKEILSLIGGLRTTAGATAAAHFGRSGELFAADLGPILRSRFRRNLRIKPNLDKLKCVITALLKDLKN
jgi:hypothetical protein